jgi:hypothetical protein
MSSNQDPGVPELTVRLRKVLALMRALAGPRGRSAVAWHGQGFSYTLLVVRDPDGPDDLDLDIDPTADHLDVLVEAIRDRLTVQP